MSIFAAEARQLHKRRDYLSLSLTIDLITWFLQLQTRRHYIPPILPMLNWYIACHFHLTFRVRVCKMRAKQTFSAIKIKRKKNVFLMVIYYTLAMKCSTMYSSLHFVLLSLFFTRTKLIERKVVTYENPISQCIMCLLMI